MKFVCYIRALTTLLVMPMKQMYSYKTPGWRGRSTVYVDSETGARQQIAKPLDASNGTVVKRIAPIPKALQVRAREFILSCVKGEGGVKKLVEKIYAQAMRGNFRAQEMLMNYIFGRPTESVKIESTNVHEISSAPVVKIIADHLRLEKLNTDAANAPTVVELSRVEEMESILNKAVENSENQTPIYKESPTPSKDVVKPPMKKRQKLKHSPKRKKK